MNHQIHSLFVKSFYARAGTIAALGLVISARSLAISITPTTDPNEMLGAALSNVANGVHVTSVSYNGVSSACGSYSNLGFAPLSNVSHGLLMTTGDATLAAGPNNDDNAGIDNGGPNQTFNNYEPGQNIDLLNVATFTVNFTAATDARLSFDFAFGSEEYYYYTNSPYNDSFFAFLDGGQHTLARDKNGKAITINNQFLSIDNRPSTFDPTNGYGLPDKPGTGTEAGINELQYDGFTPSLRTSFSVKAGQHSLSFVIGDAGDGILDSGVFLTRMLGEGTAGSGGGGGDDDTDPTPEPATLTGLGVLVAGLIGRNRKRSGNV